MGETNIYNKNMKKAVIDIDNTLEKATEKGLIATGLLFPWNRHFANNGYRLFENLNEVLGHILYCANEI